MMMEMNCSLVVCLAIALWTSGLLAQNPPTLPGSGIGGSTLTVSVVNRELEPVSGAKVELLNWTGSWEPTAWNGMTAESGEVTFDQVVLGYGSVLVSHPDYAVVMHDLSIEAATGSTPSTSRHVRVKLAPAVKSHVNLVGPDGKPVTAAQIGFLRVTHPDLDLSMTMTAEMLGRLGPGLYSSDSAGRLALPPLPAGSVVQLQAHHEEMAPVAIDHYRVSQDPTPTATMIRGAQLEVQFAGELVEQGELENIGVFMRLVYRLWAMPSGAAICETRAPLVRRARV
jgi:hypothetical protein